MIGGHHSISLTTLNAVPRFPKVDRLNSVGSGHRLHFSEMRSAFKRIPRGHGIDSQMNWRKPPRSLGKSMPTSIVGGRLVTFINARGRNSSNAVNWLLTKLSKNLSLKHTNRNRKTTRKHGLTTVKQHIRWTNRST